MFEVSQLRSALLLAVPDQWGALRARCLPPPVDIRNAAAAEWLSEQLPFARDRDAIGNTYEA